MLLALLRASAAAFLRRSSRLRASSSSGFGASAGAEPKKLPHMVAGSAAALSVGFGGRRALLSELTELAPYRAVATLLLSFSPWLLAPRRRTRYWPEPTRPWRPKMLRVPSPTFGRRTHRVAAGAVEAQRCNSSCIHIRRAGVSSKGLPTELAMRVWQHIQQDALIQPDKCESNGATVANGAAAGKRSEPPAAASQLFLRRAREENVLVRMQGRPLKVGVERQGYRNLALTNTASECEALCAARPSCEAYTWFYADAPEAWSKSCIGQDLDVAKWSPFRSQVAVSGVKFYRSGLKLSTPRGRSIAASSSSPSWREPCARRMEVLPGKLDATLLQRAIAPVGANDGPHGCHFACLRDATCDRSVWVDPKGSSLLRHVLPSSAA